MRKMWFWSSSRFCFCLNVLFLKPPYVVHGPFCSWSMQLGISGRSKRGSLGSLDCRLKNKTKFHSVDHAKPAVTIDMYVQLIDDAGVSLQVILFLVPKGPSNIRAFNT